MLVQSNKRPFVKNAILASLSLPDLATIGPFLEPILLKQCMILHEPKKAVKHIYFLETGIISLRIVAAGSILETAMVGYRGAVGASFLFGGHIPTHQSVVILPGSALRIGIEDLRRLMSERPQIREHLLRYVLALSMHGAQTGLCGVRHDLERRLACWLCLTCDALDGRVLSVTHDYLSSVLGLRRAGVTETLIRFEQQGLIRKMRGVLHVDERMRLEKKACSCYGIIASAYASVECRASEEVQVIPPLVAASSNKAYL
jgi:CRP-like cAMP-binding protein